MATLGLPSVTTIAEAWENAAKTARFMSGAVGLLPDGLSFDREGADTWEQIMLHAVRDFGLAVLEAALDITADWLPDIDALTSQLPDDLRYVVSHELGTWREDLKHIAALKAEIEALGGTNARP